MAKEAFKIGSDRHVLSTMATRLGVQVKVGELRYEQNGWRSQFLLTDCPTSSFSESDIAEYAADRGYPIASAQVRAMINTVRASKPLRLEFDFPTNAWNIVVRQGASSEFITMPDLKPFADECRAIRKSGWNTSPSTGAWSNLGIGWYTASLSEGEWRDIFKLVPYNDRDDLARRSADLASWCEDRLSRLGVPMHLFGRLGLRSVTWANSVPSWSNSAFKAYDGLTTIVGPADYRGNRMVWVGPASSAGPMCHVIDAVKLETFQGLSAGADYAPRFGKAAVALTEQQLTKLKAARDILHPGWAAVTYVSVGDDIDAGRTMASCPNIIDAKVAYTFPAVPLTLAGGTFVAVNSVVSPAFALLHLRVNDKWRVCAAFGFKEILSLGAVTAVNGTDYPVVTIRPRILGLSSTMAPMRDYITFQLARPDLSPVDRKAFEEARDKMATYVDSIMRLTVVSTEVRYPSFTMIDNLKIVRDARDGDVNMLDEPLEGGRTLRAAAQNCDKLRTKGKLIYAYSFLAENNATLDDVISPAVLAIRDFSNKTLSGVLSDSVWVFDLLQSGSVLMTLTDLEAAFVRSSGVAWAASSAASDTTLSTVLGLPNFSAELDALPVNALTTRNSYQTMLKPGVTAYAMSQAQFIGAEGYPVVQVEEDARSRMTLVYKGFGDDSTDLFLGLFFANQLDLIA